MRSTVFCVAGLLLASSHGQLVWSDEPVSPVKTVERFQVSTGGMGIYRPEKWGGIRVSLRNSLEHDVELLATTHFADDASLQYGRRMWLPAHSRLTTWHPLKMPAVNDPQRTRFELKTQVLNTSNGTETLAANEEGAQQFDQFFLIAAKEPIAALIGDLGVKRDEDAPWADTTDFALTARYDRLQRSNFVILADPLGPAGEELLDALDHLIVASDRIRTDAATIGAIRRWVTGGGRLWIMADKVSPELIESLLGDECTLTEVDRVGLTKFDVVTAPGVIGSSPFGREVERPVQFVRMIANEVRVEFVLDQWPAAIWKPYGQGLVLITTLGADGWLRPRTPTDPGYSGSVTNQTKFFPGGPLSQLALQFFTPRPTPPISQSTAETHVRQLIGYSVPSKRLVLGTLVVFTGLLAGIGLWLTHRGQLERMLTVIPLLASAAAGILLFAGWSSRSKVPVSTAVVQLVQAVPGTDDVRTTGLAGVFSSDSRSTALSGERGGWTIPQALDSRGAVRRIVWSDIDHWSWEKLPDPPGMRTVAFQTAGTSDVPLSAIVRFDQRGMNGHVSLPPGLLPADAVIVTSHGRLGVDLRPEGEFTVRSTPLSTNQYLSASVLSDEQQRRNLFMSEILQQIPGVENPPVPTLYVWTWPWKVGMSLTRKFDLAGSALVVIPVHWRRPQIPHSPVNIPSPMLPFREVQGPDGLSPGGLYDIRNNKWIERTGYTACWLAFEVPKSLLPLDVKSATVTFKVLGPMGHLELSGDDGGRPRAIKVWDDPVGTITHEITDSRLLKLDDRGRLLLRIDVGRKPLQPPGAPVGPDFNPKIVSNQLSGKTDPVNYWQFEDVSLQLSAEIPKHDTNLPHAHEAAE